jgi:hypothetical protein
MNEDAEKRYFKRMLWNVSVAFPEQWDYCEYLIYVHYQFLYFQNFYHKHVLF